MSAAASIAAMRPWLRFTAVVLGLFALYAIYAGSEALIGDSQVPSEAGALILILALTSLVPALLIWRQAEAATRYLGEPTAARLHELTTAMRHFWRLSGIVAVLQLTGVASLCPWDTMFRGFAAASATAPTVGFALHGGG